MLSSDFESIANDLQKRFRDVLLADEDGSLAPDLLSVEEDLVFFTRILGLGLMKTYVSVREEQAKASRGRCSCGRETELHRTTCWTRETPWGPVEVRDPYAYCRVCRDSERPLHRWLGTDRETWSLLVQQDAVDLATDESCGKAVAKLKRHHPGVAMERTTALRLLHEHGGRAREFINAKLADARKLAELPWGRRGPVADELEAEFDGGMIPVATLEPIQLAEGEEPELTPVRGLPKRRKKCRWEEVKAGLVQVPGETERLYSLRPTSGLDEAFDDLLGLACMKDWGETTQVRGIADGAIHIRPRMEETFSASPFRFILDRPHAKEHLTSAGEQLEQFTGVPAQQWAATALATMERGDAAAVVAELQQAYADDGSRNDTLRLEAGYFERNKDAVAYADYREQRWSTASSEIESGHGHLVQARLKISGAWWHPNGVDDILALRMLKANSWWDEYWTDQRDKWRSRARTFAD